MTRFSNVEQGVETYQIAETGDYLVERDGQWYYWLGSSSPTDNHGPFETAQAALDSYNKDDDNYTLSDLSGILDQRHADETSS